MLDIREASKAKAARPKSSRSTSRGSKAAVPGDEVLPGAQMLADATALPAPRELPALRPEGEVVPWGVADFESLTATDLEALLGLQAEVVLLGTGATHRMPHPRLTAALTRAGIGVEAMDSFAACRTYNILMSEGRRVVAAILSG